MSQQAASLIGSMGAMGLYAAVVGFAVMLLMPERTGHGLGSHLAVAGGVAMGYAIVLAHGL